MMPLHRQLLRAALPRPLVRAFSAAGAIDVSKLTVQRTSQPKERLPKDKLIFGHSFTDHMLEVDWTKQDGWSAPRITPYHDFTLSPAASALHYALQCFEGMKAYKDAQGRIRLFRPDCNLARLNNSMSRLYMPNFDEPAFMECIKHLLKEDADWFPEGDGYSIYIRPTAISTYPFLGVGATESVKLYVILSPVGPYYPDGFKPVRLFADTKHVRACPGGVGNSKLGSNYGPTIAPQMEALKKHKAHQILWLYGDEHRVTEVGSMNIFFLLHNENGEKELVTPPLDTGDILPGVTRRSMLELARQWNDFKVSERKITMAELVAANEQGRLLEAFGAGTAAVISPVSEIIYQDKHIVVPTGSGAGPLAQKMWDTLTDIQYGRVDHPWSMPI